MPGRPDAHAIGSAVDRSPEPGYRAAVQQMIIAWHPCDRRTDDVRGTYERVLAEAQRRRTAIDRDDPEPVLGPCVDFNVGTPAEDPRDEACAASRLECEVNVGRTYLAVGVPRPSSPCHVMLADKDHVQADGQVNIEPANVLIG
jgi:hypothetical protein